MRHVSTEVIQRQAFKVWLRMKQANEENAISIRLRRLMKRHYELISKL